MKNFALGLCILAFSAPQAVFSQAVYGSISGNVTDSSGSVVPNVKVTITDTGKGIVNNTITNESGNYTQGHLIVGIYEVRMEAAGFSPYTARSVHVEVDAVTTINARLALGTVGETVNVTSEAPLLKAEKADVSDTMTQHAVQELPVFGRDMSRLYFLARCSGHRHECAERTASRHFPSHHRRPILGRHLFSIGRHRQSRLGARRARHQSQSRFSGRA